MKCAKCNNETVGKSKYCRAHRAESRANFKAMIKEKTQQKEMEQAGLYDLFNRAWDAGVEAANAHTPIPMVVQERSNPMDDNSPVTKTYAPVMDGVCGFASVIIKPANCKFANWLKKNHSTYKHYYGGLNFPIHAYNQSYERKTAHAGAMVKVLSEAGINCYVDSRLD